MRYSTEMKHTEAVLCHVAVSQVTDEESVSVLCPLKASASPKPKLVA